jgi:hypothetical protein
MLLNRYLSIEIFFVHIGHGALFWVVIAILAIELPWWASLFFADRVFSVAGWAYEVRFVYQWQSVSGRRIDHATKSDRGEKNPERGSDADLKQMTKSNGWNGCGTPPPTSWLRP